MPTRTRSKNTNSNSSQSILLEEFRGLHSDYLHQRNQGITRVNFFITAMSVVLGGALVFATSENQAIIPFVRPILIIALTLLIIIGVDVYNFLIQRDSATDRQIRGMARIRNYFIQLDPSLSQYFVNKIYDTPSGYLIARSSGMRRSTEIIIGFLTGITSSVMLSYLISSFSLIIIGIVVAMLVAVALELKARQRLEKAFRSADKDTRFNNNFEHS